jgi:hypothetical protein
MQVYISYKVINNALALFPFIFLFGHAYQYAII